MTLLAKALDLETAPSVRVTDTLEGLSAIQSPECAASIWQRRPLPSFQSWIDALPNNHAVASQKDVSLSSTRDR